MRNCYRYRTTDDFPARTDPAATRQRHSKRWLHNSWRCRSNPVLMIFEDVHWVDPTSVELLGRTVDRYDPPCVANRNIPTGVSTRPGSDDLTSPPSRSIGSANAKSLR